MKEDWTGSLSGKRIKFLLTWDVSDNSWTKKFRLNFSLYIFVKEKFIKEVEYIPHFSPKLDLYCQSWEHVIPLWRNFMKKIENLWTRKSRWELLSTIEKFFGRDWENWKRRVSFTISAYQNALTCEISSCGRQLLRYGKTQTEN